MNALSAGLDQFHFAQPLWLLALPLAGLIVWWQWRGTTRALRGAFQRYADPHLLPHLTGTRDGRTATPWRRLRHWSLVWLLLLLALAGPRWDATDVRLFHPGNHLLILLDISRSMQVADVTPNRLARARQELQDLIAANRGLRMGVVLFASVPQVVAPLTDDTQTLLAALPALSTELASPQLQGSRLAAALDRADQLLAGLPADSARAVLLLSDGDFAEPELTERVRRLAESGVRLHVLGIGTPAGGRVPAPQGGWFLDRSGLPVESPLAETTLETLAAAGGGSYRRADYRDADTRAILKAVAGSQLPPEAGDDRTRIWNERFWIPALLALALLVPLWRELGGRWRRRS